jgi:tRNA (uracil-5-)-methyltransferase TRM9
MVCNPLLRVCCAVDVKVGTSGSSPLLAPLKDFVISIAAIHHLSTHARRVESVRSILKPLTYRRSGPFASFIVYVWAFEQSENSKRKMGSAAVEGSGDGMTAEQDVLVPWVLQSQTQPSHENQNTQPRVYHRYYHLFKQGELRELVLDAAREERLMINNDDDNVSGQGGKWLRIVGEGYEKDNWWLEGEVGVF